MGELSSFIPSGGANRPIHSYCHYIQIVSANVPTGQFTVTVNITFRFRQCVNCVQFTATVNITFRLCLCANSSVHSHCQYHIQIVSVCKQFSSQPLSISHSNCVSVQTVQFTVIVNIIFNPGSICFQPWLITLTIHMSLACHPSSSDLSDRQSTCP